MNFSSGRSTRLRLVIIMIEMMYMVPCYGTNNVSMSKWPGLIETMEFYGHCRRIVNI